MEAFHCEYAWLGDAAADRAIRDVRIEITDGRIGGVLTDVPAGRDAQRLAGLTLPGLVNTHSHVFHRAIRGLTETGAADFWRWRDLMYGVAGRLDPDSMFRLARATYAEMALAGITAVGEFHYLHHDAEGRPYREPNAMAEAVVGAAREVGLRLTLIDACYLQADVDGKPLEGVQRRFGGGDWHGWADRATLMSAGPGLRLGAAIHSVRAVPQEALTPIATFARVQNRPLHVHLSEQPAENEACLRVHGVTPTRLLADADVLGEATTAVHATHLTSADIRLLGDAATAVSMCVTTERNLADGIGPAPALARAGAPLVLGTDGHMTIDMFEEARGVELDERLRSGRRGHFRPGQLAVMLTSAGAASLGWDDAGCIEPGALADLTTVRLDTVRTAGARAVDPLAPVLYAATAADVDTVIVGGDVIVSGGRHRSIDAARELGAAIAAVVS
ncbi:MAG TPA: formimidoylglutamate deiminase [Jatrophihabitantaceae bacterium]|jgi:formiminoglutamate deiminase|nr:formimidoylglutamate deiminase [Jatrophihabitantaceae bacterium]